MVWQIPFFPDGAFHFGFVQYLYEFLLHICIYWLMTQTLQVWITLESSLQWVNLTQGWIVVVRYVWLWFNPQHSHFVLLACKLCRTLHHFLCLQFFLWLTDDVYFGSLGFYVPPDLDVLSHFHIFSEGEMTNIFSYFARRGSTDSHPSSVRTAKSSLRVPILYSNGSCIS